MRATAGSDHLLPHVKNALRILHLSATRVPVSTPYETRGRSVFPHARAKAKPGFFIQSYPLSFLAVVPVDSVRDAFPRDFFVSFMNMLLGLPRAACYAFGGKPLQGNRGTSCGCGQPFDEDGLHALTCPTWYNRTSVVGHNQVLQSINELLITVGSHARLPNITFPGRRRVTPEAQVFVLISTSAIRGIQEPITALAARSATFLSRIRAMLQEHTQMELPRLVAGGTTIDIRRV